MGFKLLLDKGDGEAFDVLYETDEHRIERVGLVTDKGEGGAIRVDLDQPEVIVTLKRHFSDGRPTLHDVEAMAHPLMTGADVEARNDALGTLPSATNQGGTRLLDASIEEAEKRKDEEQRAADQAAASDEDARGEHGPEGDVDSGGSPPPASTPIMTSHGGVVETRDAGTPSNPDFQGFQAPETDKTE